MTPEELAAKAGIKNVDQIRQWRHRYGGRVPSPRYAMAIETATNKEVTRQELRPKDFWLIWHDLPEPKPPGRRAAAMKAGA